MQALSNFLKNRAHGWLILVLLAAEIYFNAVVLPAQARVLGETGPIDLKFFYTPETAYAMVEAYGPAVRLQYRTFALTGDILYPIVYTLLFGLLITWLFRRGLPAGSSLHRLNVVPFGAGFFDVLENLAVAAMLSGFPAEPAWLAWIATLFTMLKWLFAAASLALILYGLVLSARMVFSRKPGGAAGAA